MSTQQHTPTFLPEAVVYITEDELCRISTEEREADFLAGAKRHEVAIQKFTESKAIRACNSHDELVSRLQDHIDNGPGIDGPECPSCGRDNSDYGNVCTSDDCMGVMDRAALAHSKEA